MKISARITAIIGGFSILVMVVSAVLINFASRGITETILLKGEESRVTERMFDIERLLYERYLDILHLADNHDLQKSVVDLHFSERDWAGMEVLGADKKVIYSSVSDGRVGEEFEEIEPEEDFSYTDPKIVDYLSEEVVIFTKSIQKSGKPAGYLIGYFKWERVEQIINQDEDIGVHLLDGNYNQIATNEDEEDVELDLNGGLFDRVKGEKQGSFTGKGLGDKQSVIVYDTQEKYLDFPSRNWVLVFESPVSASFAVSQRATIQMLLSLGFLLFLGSIAIWFFISVGIANPLSHLTTLATKMAGGDLSARAKVESGDEIGELGRAFNDMAGKLSGIYSSLESQVAQRTMDLDAANAQLEKKQLALMNVLEDVSKEKAYKEKESQSLLEILNEGIVITNEKAQIVYVNPAFEKMFGISESEAKGKTFAEITRAFDFKDKELGGDILSESSALSKKYQGARLQMTRKDKSKIAVVTTASAIKIGSDFKGIIRLLHDYSEDLKLQRQKDDFFSIASHELRTPLTVISGNLDNIIQGYGGSKFTDADKNLLTDVMAASDRLIDMIEDFLNVSRLDQGRLKVEVMEVDNCKLLSDVVSEMTKLAADKGLSLISKPHTKEHGHVMADLEKLREIYINLIGNSLKFTKKGGIAITHDAQDGYLVVKIADTGIGIAKGKQGMLFQRFQQAMERTLAREAGGTGLGLYISKEFAKLMGGDLWLESSDLNKGSVFALKIPLAGNGKIGK